MFPSRSGSSDASRGKKRSVARSSTAATSLSMPLLLVLVPFFFLMTAASTEASKPSITQASTTKLSSAAASVKLHATWEAAPLVLEAVEFLVRFVACSIAILRGEKSVEKRVREILIFFSTTTTNAGRRVPLCPLALRRARVVPEAAREQQQQQQQQQQEQQQREEEE